MTFDPAWLRLYFIMGSNNTTKDPVNVLRAAIKGGITAYQFREKGSGAKTGEEKIALGRKLRSVCKENKIPFIVNDDPELALKLEADGLHIGQNDGKITEIRQLVPSHYFIGVSTSTKEEALLAENQGADYIGVGPIFKTKTKEDARRPIGIKGLREIREQTSTIPLVAISGITKESVEDLLENGASGIAVISAISKAEDIYEAARSLSES